VQYKPTKTAQNVVHMWFAIQVQETIAGQLKCIDRSGAACGPWFAHPSFKVIL